MPALVACAADDVETVLDELLSNAVKYGAGTIAVQVEARRAHARLTFEDGGAGVPPRLRRRVTRKFARGDGAGPAQGFGIGLWLVRRIARGHGGDLELGAGKVSVTFRLAPNVVTR
jgi:signal transduction histidine kinase